MRKRIFVALIASLCIAEFAALAAVNQRRGTTQKETVETASVAARSAVRKDTAQKNSGVAARSAVKQTAPKSNVVAARAGTTQKAINTGTKVATATENTAVPKECQDNFNGCMDAFCMLDNASGGRCQCSDKIVEYDKILEDILRLDEQSYVMATEGVERLKMGDAESAIMARAKAAGDKVVADKDNKDNKANLARKLDMSVFDNNIFVDTDDIFGDGKSDGDISTFADKKGDELYKAAGKMCVAQIPAKCKSYGSMLQLVYAQKIKSDCMAYENSLKAQKSQSQQKLQTAQKALRDAALDEYKEQNRYGTVGECAVAFAQCMQTTAECGEDYTGCVTFAAKENVKSNNKGPAAKQQKIKGTIKGADITLAASTMEQLLAKKPICERITKQCVNANKNDAVWNTFLRNAAPALKSAEETAEQRLRMECIPTLTKCFSDACKSNMDPNNPDSYDMCLSDPSLYKSLCKVQLEPCLEATGGDYTDENIEKSSLWKGLLAALNAMKVDACTKEVKNCLTSDNACGADYSACIGLSTEAIVNLCPTQKLTACMEKNDVDSVRDYVAEVAQGLSLQIDNNMLITCQNALDKAMENYCGDKATCPNASLLTSTITDMLRAQVCKEGGEKCYDDPSVFSVQDLLKGDVLATVRGPDLTQITYDSNIPEKDIFKFRNANFATSNSDLYTMTTKLRDMLNAAWNSKIGQIESDPKVAACLTGRTVQTFGTAADNTAKQKLENSADTPRYTNLTQSARMNIADDLMKRFTDEYSEALKKVRDEKLPALAEKLAQKIEKEIGDLEAAIDVSNKAICDAYTHKEKLPIAGCVAEDTEIAQKTATYNATTNECVVVSEIYGPRLYKKASKKCKCLSLGTCEYLKLRTETEKVTVKGLDDVTDKMDSVNNQANQ